MYAHMKSGRGLAGAVAAVLVCGASAFAPLGGAPSAQCLYSGASAVCGASLRGRPEAASFALGRSNVWRGGARARSGVVGLRAESDYYQKLGVQKGASDADIKKGFRDRARKLHPDVNKADDAQEKFQEIQNAYEVLSDPSKKQMYDQFGEAGVRGASGGGGGGQGFQDFGDFSPFGDIFESFFGGGGGGGGRQRRKQGPQQGDDLRVDVEIDFMQAIFGGDEKVKISHLETCTTCTGDGMKPGTRPRTCGTCSGSGVVTQVAPRPPAPRATTTLIASASVSVPAQQAGSCRIESMPGAYSRWDCRDGDRLLVGGQQPGCCFMHCAARGAGRPLRPGACRISHEASVNTVHVIALSVKRFHGCRVESAMAAGCRVFVQTDHEIASRVECLLPAGWSVGRLQGGLSDIRGGLQVARTPLGMLQQQSACPQCQGSGQIVDEVCGGCTGRGRLQKSKQLMINVPAGVDSGSRLRIRKEGDAGPKGGPPGDLYVFLTVRPHKEFKRDGSDIYSSVCCPPD